MAPGLVAVVLEGRLQVEGSSEHRVEVFPARRAESAGAWFVEPWARDLSTDVPIEVLSPAIDAEERAAVDPGVPLALTARVREPGTVYVSFDAGDPLVTDAEAGVPFTVESDRPGVDTAVVLYHQGPTVTGRAFTTATGSDEQGPVGVVERYVAAVADGDLEAAWALVAEPSRHALGGYDGFEALRSALSEGIGAWASAHDRRAFVVPVDSATDTWAVTLMGTVTQEGSTSLAATSTIVYGSGDGDRVSPFEGALGDSGFVSFDPAPGGDLEPDGTVVVELPDGMRSIQAFVDETPADLAPLDEGRELPRFAVTPQADPGAGQHATTIVLTAADGARTAVAAPHHTPELLPPEPPRPSEPVWNAPRLDPQPGLAQLTSAELVGAVGTADPLHPVVVFWAGSPECTGLDHVNVDETASRVTVDVVVGRPSADTLCTAIAQRYSTRIELDSPIGDREIVSAR